MGNCCTNLKKSEKQPSPASAPLVPATQQIEKPSERFLKFKSKGQNFSYTLEYCSNKCLSTYLNHIILNHPELALEDIQLCKKYQEITDFHQPLRDLDIHPSDILYVESIPKIKKQKSFSQSSIISNEEIAEEESTTKLQVVGIQAKLNLGNIKTESTGDAASLWRSAMPSPKMHRNHIAKDGDASSLINPMDLTIENKQPMQFTPYDVKNGQSVLLDSDDSFLKSDVKTRDSMQRHPYDFFRDLQGPFSILKQF